MLKFTRHGKTLGILKDDADEPEGEAFNFQDGKEPDTEPASQQEEAGEVVEEESEEESE